MNSENENCQYPNIKKLEEIKIEKNNSEEDIAIPGKKDNNLPVQNHQGERDMIFMYKK